MSEVEPTVLCLHCGEESAPEGTCEWHPQSPLVDPSSDEARTWLKAEDDKRFLRSEITYGIGFAVPALFLGYVLTIFLFGPTDFGPRTTWIVMRPYVFGFAWAAIFFPAVWLGIKLAKRNFKPRFEKWWPDD